MAGPQSGGAFGTVSGGGRVVEVGTVVWVGIVVLVSTFTAHRIAFGLSLIVAFSVGLAAALVVVGIVALRARTFVARKLGGPALWILPMLSALVIVGFGVFFVARGVSGL